MDVLAAVSFGRERLHHARDDVVDRTDRLTCTVDAFALCEPHDRRDHGEPRLFVAAQQLADGAFRPFGPAPRMDRADRRALPTVGGLDVGDVAIHFQPSIMAKLTRQNPRRV
jgi:hypothetical protein